MSYWIREIVSEAVFIVLVVIVYGSIFVFAIRRGWIKVPADGDSPDKSD